MESSTIKLLTSCTPTPVLQTIKYRTEVAISAENTKNVGRSAGNICGFEIDAALLSLIVVY